MNPSRKAGSAACAALLAVLLALLPASAFAHAVLVASEPSDGAMLEASPEQLTLTFNEPVSPLAMRLLAPGGGEHEIAVKQQGTALSISPAGTLRHGTHLLSWRVVSADGHPVGGSVLFSVGHASEAGSWPPAADRLVGVAAWLARIVMYVAMFVGVGGTFFVFWLGGGPIYAVERLLYALLVTGLIAAPLSVGLQGADLLGVSLALLVEPVVWRSGIGSAYAATAILSFVAIFAAQLAFTAGSPGRARLASAIAALSVGLALAASGHASTANPQFLMRPAVFVHALGILFWIGALLPLAGLLRARKNDARTALLRFSRAAPFSVAVLIVSGIALTVVQVEEASALWSTDYGRLLLAKFGLLAILFAIALYNRRALTGRVVADSADARRKLSRMIAVELALALMIFGIAAAWRFTPPPRALASIAAAPLAVHIHTDRAMADVRFEPGRAGPVTASIALMTGDFGPLDAKEVTLILSTEDVEPIRRPAQRGADMVWRVPNLIVPAPGRWTVRVDILVTDFEKVMLEETVEFRR